MKQHFGLLLFWFTSQYRIGGSSFIASIYFLLFLFPTGWMDTSHQTPEKVPAIAANTLAAGIILCGASYDQEPGWATELLNMRNLDESYSFAGTGSISWSQVAPQPVANTEAQTVVVGNKMYVFGGYDKLKTTWTPTDRAYAFDPKANTWTPLASMPPMNGSGHGGVTHAGMTTDGKDIYFAGGYVSSFSGTGQVFGTKEVWRYSIASNAYTRLPDLPMAVAAGDLEYISGKLHWVGGTNKGRTEDLGVHYVFDLTNPAKGWTVAASLPNPRNHLGGAVYQGMLYIFGGQHGQDGKMVAQSDVHRYDPATNQWKQMAAMPRALSHMAGSTFTYGDRIFILGGEIGHGPAYYVADVVAYHPLTNTWTKYTDLPAKRASGVAGTINGLLYYSSGGSSNVTYKGVLASEPPPATNDLWLEAECSTAIGANWMIGQDISASGNAYVVARNGFSTGPTPPTTLADRVSFQFTLPTSGSYYVHTRVKAPSDSNNSFWVRIDSGSWLKWHINPTYNVFDWRTVRNTLFTFNTSGLHTIDFAYREEATLLDKIYITPKATLPVGTGGPASNCQATSTLAGTAKYESEVAGEPIDLSTANMEADCLSCDQGEFTVFPNPSEGLFTVRTFADPFRTDGWAVVSTLQGTLLKKIPVIVNSPNSLTIDLTDISPGVYLLRLETETQTVIKKIEKR